MAADLTIEPWSRLVRLAPGGSTGIDLQSAANRYEKSQDIYAAAADLWEEAALLLDTSPPPNPIVGGEAPIASVSQDGVAVTYSRGVIDYSQDQRLKQISAYRRIAHDFRQKSQPYTVPLGGVDMVDRYSENAIGGLLDPENGIIETYGYFE